MNKFTILAASILSLASLSAQAIAIPNIFGSYTRGAEEARQANAQDAYYYQVYSRPEMYIWVYDANNRKKSNMQVSLSKGENLCWQLYPVNNGNQYGIGEIFYTPQALSIGTPFFGWNSTQEEIHNSVQMTESSYGFNRRQVSRYNNIGTCWAFNPQTTPKGRHYIQIQIGEVDFGRIAFDIVN